MALHFAAAEVTIKDLNPSPQDKDQTISARGVSRVYRTGDVTVNALDGIDFDLFRDEIVVLLGPSGSGKSTLLNIIGGRDAPSSGQVLRVLHESAGVVAAGEPLLEIRNPGELEIVAELLSTDAVRVHEGDAVIIEEWGGAGALRGQVRRIEPTGSRKVPRLSGATARNEDSGATWNHRDGFSLARP